ncbi:hypothetical protein LTR27_003493 [Elasticomyces elasticus]|nr:hypothetical protein LTR27_003493 [Elasticomyces elasticus]
MAGIRGVHWLAPTIMISTFISGLLLATAHHFFYAYLAAHSAPTGSYSFSGGSLSKQRFNTAIGTAFSFLVKASFTVAVGTAYTQIFWKLVRSPSQNHTLRQLDSYSSVLSNALDLGRPNLWWKNSVLFLLAVVFWCVPIASIVTPATLSVESALQSPVPSMMLEVPQLDWTSFSFAEVIFNWGDQPQFVGPSPSVNTIAAATMALGQILPVAPPSSNASWTLNFWGPALRCAEVEDERRTLIIVNLWNKALGGSKSNVPGNPPPVPRPVTVWVPWDSRQTWNSLDPRYDDLAENPQFNGDLPFLGNDTNATLSTATLAFDRPASIFAAVLPNMMPLTGPFTLFANGSDCDYYSTINLTEFDKPLNCVSGAYKPAVISENATILECLAMNTSYTVLFNYTNGGQEVKIQTFRESDSVITATDIFFNGSVPGQFGETFTTYNNSDTLNGSAFDPQAIRLTAYQGLLMAFNGFLVGSAEGYTIASGVEPSDGAALFDTILADTDELEFLHWRPASPYNSSLGLARSPSVNKRGSLGTAMEQLFQNFTINLMTDPDLNPSYTSHYAPSRLTNVTSITYHNIYVYAWQTLCVAYGVAAALSALAVALGLAAIYAAGASYDNLFSTIVRVARTADLSEDVKGGDGSGQQPLPSYLAEAQLVVSTQVARRAYHANGGVMEGKALMGNEFVSTSSNVTEVQNTGARSSKQRAQTATAVKMPSRRL